MENYTKKHEAGHVAIGIQWARILCIFMRNQRTMTYQTNLGPVTCGFKVDVCDKTFETPKEAQAAVRKSLDCQIGGHKELLPFDKFTDTRYHELAKTIQEDPNGQHELPAAEQTIKDMRTAAVGQALLKGSDPLVTDPQEILQSVVIFQTTTLDQLLKK